MRADIWSPVRRPARVARFSLCFHGILAGGPAGVSKRVGPPLVSMQQQQQPPPGPPSGGVQRPPSGYMAPPPPHYGGPPPPAGMAPPGMAPPGMAPMGMAPPGGMPRPPGMGPSSGPGGMSRPAGPPSQGGPPRLGGMMQPPGSASPGAGMPRPAGPPSAGAASALWRATLRRPTLWHGPHGHAPAAAQRRAWHAAASAHGVPQPMAPPGAPAVAPPTGAFQQMALQPPGAPPAQGQPPGMTPGMAPPPPSFGMPPPGRQPGGPPPPQQQQRQQQQQPAPVQKASGNPGLPSSNRIDPSQIPRPAAGTSTAEPLIHETFVAGQHSPPPPSTSSFIVKDTGNCSPRYMRLSLNQCPSTAESLTTTSMPLVAMVQPLGLPDPQEDPLQVVDFGEDGPVRCSGCKAYMNPFMRWLEGGRRFQCNFCGALTECPTFYFAHIGADGRRSDVAERPELSKGSVELVATKDYMVRPPMPVTHFFLIDSSAYAIESGATASACAALGSVLDSIQGGDSARVGIATFDEALNFFTIKPGKQATMVVMPDSSDPYCPTPSSLVVNLRESIDEIRELLEAIPTMHPRPTPESIGGAALFGALQVLKDCGGKVSMFLASLPNTGMMAVKARPQGQKSGDRDPQKVLQCADPAWTKLGQQCADFQVSVDLFLLSKHYMDIATLSEVVHTTGGSLYEYDGFMPELDQGQLENDLRWNLVRPQGMEAVMRVRCSAGLSVEEYSGAIYQRTLTDVDLPAIDSDKAILVKIKHDEKLPDNGNAFFQAALLYTNTSGERRIRLHTIAVPCTSVLGTLYRAAELDTQVFYMARKAAETLPGGTLAAVREQVTASCVDVLYAYRRYCATSTSSGQLILPEALKLLPLYTLALTKSGALRGDMPPDARSVWLLRLRTMGPAAMMPLIYPRLYNIREAGQDGSLMPAALSLSSEKLDPRTIFLLENGVEAFMYVGKQAPAEMVQDLLGLNSLEEAGSGPNSMWLSLERRDNQISRVTNDLMDEIRRSRASFLRLRIIKRSDPLEPVFFNLLLEDRSVAGMSYVEFLCHVHRQIQNKFA
eukprot:jgi/Tetstr1/428156/TSEL_018207.t1